MKNNKEALLIFRNQGNSSTKESKLLIKKIRQSFSVYKLASFPEKHHNVPNLLTISFPHFVEETKKLEENHVPTEVWSPLYEEWIQACNQYLRSILAQTGIKVPTKNFFTIHFINEQAWKQINQVQKDGEMSVGRHSFVTGAVDLVFVDKPTHHQQLETMLCIFHEMVHQLRVMVFDFSLQKNEDSTSVVLNRMATPLSKIHLQPGRSSNVLEEIATVGFVADHVENIFKMNPTWSAMYQERKQIALQKPYTYVPGQETLLTNLFAPDHTLEMVCSYGRYLDVYQTLKAQIPNIETLLLKAGMGDKKDRVLLVRSLHNAFGREGLAALVFAIYQNLTWVSYLLEDIVRLKAVAKKPREDKRINRDIYSILSFAGLPEEERQRISSHLINPDFLEIAIKQYS